MHQKSTRLAAVAMCSSLVVSCAVPLSGPRTSSNSIAAPRAEAQRPANEVLLTRKDLRPVLGKLVGIEGQRVTFLPAPYWNVPAQTVLLDDIVTIEVTDVTRAKGKAAGLSFATGFVVTGALCGASAEYDEDYGECLVAAAVIGGVAGLIGLGVGALVDSGRPRIYRFDRMEPREKPEAIQRLVAR